MTVRSSPTSQAREPGTIHIGLASACGARHLQITNNPRLVRLLLRILSSYPYTLGRRGMRLVVVMIQFKLGPPRYTDGTDPMGRDWVGWTPEQTPDQLYQRNRGVWHLGKRAERQRYCVFTSTETGLIVAVVEITGLETFAGDPRKAIVGDVLTAGHRAFDDLMGKPALDAYRNPMTYPKHFLDQRLCACGCGESVSHSRDFQSGHDQRAVHTRITQEWGGTLGFITWFDATYSNSTAQQT
jgi:hypothetical protein